MEVRKITAEDALRAAQVQCVGFEGPLQGENTVNAQLYQQEVLFPNQQNPKTRDQKYWDERYAAFDDDGAMMGTLAALPFQVHFDGHIVPMSGIGGVATLPQYRKKGAIKACFIKAFEDMFADGQVLSVLYPFSSSYYRNFGYELCSEIVEWDIPLSAIKPCQDDTTSMHLYEGGQDVSDFEKVYDALAPQYNLAVLREEVDYASIRAANPFKEPKFGFICKDAGGNPIASLIFHKEIRNGVAYLNCWHESKADHLLFKDVRALQAMLTFALSYQAGYQRIYFCTPADVRAEAVLGDMRGAKKTIRHHAMVRVVNAEKALYLAKYRGDGQLAVEIFDKYCAFNCHTYLVNFQNGQAVSVKISDGSPDISMNISTFSAFLLGCFDTQDLTSFLDVKIHNPQVSFDKVFYKKKTWIGDYF